MLDALLSLDKKVLQDIIVVPAPDLGFLYCGRSRVGVSGCPCLLARRLSAALWNKSPPPHLDSVVDPKRRRWMDSRNPPFEPVQRGLLLSARGSVGEKREMYILSRNVCEILTATPQFKQRWGKDWPSQSQLICNPQIP